MKALILAIKLFISCSITFILWIVPFFTSIILWLRYEEPLFLLLLLSYVIFIPIGALFINYFNKLISSK